MYELMHGIQSGMLKLDPCSMNKAIIAKIKQLNAATTSQSEREKIAKLNTEPKIDQEVNSGEVVQNHFRLSSNETLFHNEIVANDPNK